MYRNVAVGRPVLGEPDEWPELGEGSKKPESGVFRLRNTSNPSSSQVSHTKNTSVQLDSSAVRLDADDFPALSSSASKRVPKDVDEQVCATHKRPQKKKAKKSTPLQIDICDIIQATALKKKQRCEIGALKKSSKLKRKVLSGNLLDSDQPKLHKGKVRPWKPRDLSKTKKIICASRKVRLSRLPFTREMLKFKENLGLALKKGDVDVSKLADGLTGISLDDNRDETAFGHKVATQFAKNVIHNKKFRPYCDNIVTEELRRHTSELIVKLRKFQDKMHAVNEVKAHAKRRYVCGFKESSKFLLADRVKMLIVATNLEMEEGLPSIAILNKVLDAAEKRNVPIVYGGLSRHIGYWALKKAKISVLAVMNYDGANDTYANVMRSLESAKKEYAKLLEKICDLYQSKSSRLANIDVIQKEVEDEIKETILSKLKE